MSKKYNEPFMPLIDRSIDQLFQCFFPLPKAGDDFLLFLSIYPNTTEKSYALHSYEQIFMKFCTVIVSGQRWCLPVQPVCA